MMKSLAVILLALAAIAAMVLVYGALHWRAGSRALRDGLIAARVPIKQKVVDFRELDGLPAPVQRYFRIALKEGRPIVAGARVRHHGTFNMGRTADQWKPFTSDQMVITSRPGFDWDGEIAMFPGLTVRIHDAYAAGEGTLHAALLGLFTVADLHGGGEIAEGELMRFFAEAAWYPTALLPSQGVIWEAVSSNSARASLVDGAVKVTMLFSFNESGVIESVRADSRGRAVGSRIIPTPWHGRFWNYQVRQEMYVPLDGEAAWLPADGAKPYWRGSITAIDYDFAG
jgi:hypothetical protein